MRIGEWDSGKRVLIVAEIGNNHEGSLPVARELVHRAAIAGADAVKFQTFRTELFVRPSDHTRFRRLKGFELAPSAFAELIEIARGDGLLALATPLDLESARFLGPRLDAFKVASGDVDFFPLIETILGYDLPVIVSTGATELDEVSRTVDYVRERLGDLWRERLALLHCVSSYPAPPEQANLRALPALAQAFGCPVGYSDHTIGNEVAAVAVALGARIIEKHFTLDHQHSSFRDHLLSATPAEMADLVARIRYTERILGSGEKIVQPAELDMQSSIRRSIVARRDLSAGHCLEAGDLTWLRPRDGLRPGEEARVVGHRLRRPVRCGESLLADDLEKPDA